jgi:hypothetical protein
LTSADLLVLLFLEFLHQKVMISSGFSNNRVSVCTEAFTTPGNLLAELGHFRVCE